jgi:hypothetical protein
LPSSACRNDTEPPDTSVQATTGVPDTWHDTAEEARAAAEAWLLTQLSATQRLAVYAARAAFHSDPKETT